MWCHPCGLCTGTRVPRARCLHLRSKSKGRTWFDLKRTGVIVQADGQRGAWLPCLRDPGAFEQPRTNGSRCGVCKSESLGARVFSGCHRWSSSGYFSYAMAKVRCVLEGSTTKATAKLGDNRLKVGL